jgi:prephenate dehydratase
MKVSIQGEPGSFSHEAAGLMLPGAEVRFCALSAEAFEALASGAVDAAVIPIENSLAGSVTEHFDLLLKHDLKIDREMHLRIRHNLIAVPGAKIDGLRQVYSHPIALAQCRNYLATHTQMKIFPYYDTAGSVKTIIERGNPEHAAIASTAAAAHYGAQILAGDIEDNPKNFTRFYLIHRAVDAVTAQDANKVSLAFALENRPGSLVQALQAIAALGANLTKIESRPVPGKPWEYIFYVDAQLTGAREDERIVDALKPYCSMVKELGLYKEHEE